MSINLNDSTYDSNSSNVAIFNGGNAGIVNDVTMAVEKKKADDKENAPDYKLVFTDSSGATCNTSFWYVTEATQYSSVEQQTLKQGKVMKHLIHAIYGADFQIPVVETPKQLLDTCMKLIRDGLAGGVKFRIFANYGTVQYTKKYIQPHSWVPFIEPMTVPEADTRLKAGDLDAMERLVEDTVGAPVGATASTAGDDDDWD